MSFLIGEMNRHIEIQYAEESNIRGELFKEWKTIRKCFAEVRFVGAHERFKAEREIAVKTCVFKIHYCKDNITEKDRILFDNDIFNITGIRELGFRERIELSGELVEPNSD